METLKPITTRHLRQLEPAAMGEWIVQEVEDGGYTVRCGESVLYTINSAKPRVFRSLDAVKQALKLEIGITEFKVEALKGGGLDG
jgi:hypothetical protein